MRCWPLLLFVVHILIESAPLLFTLQTGMDFYVVLERPGYRVARRRKQLAKVGIGCSLTVVVNQTLDESSVQAVADLLAGLCKGQLRKRQAAG